MLELGAYLFLCPKCKKLYSSFTYRVIKSESGDKAHATFCPSCGEISRDEPPISFMVQVEGDKITPIGSFWKKKLKKKVQ